MLKNSQNTNILEISELTPTSKNSKVFNNRLKNSSFSKENNYILVNNNIIPKKKTKHLNIKTLHINEGATTHEDTYSKISNSQNILKKKQTIKKRCSYKNKKRENEKIIKLLRNNEKIKIPTGKRKSNVEKNDKLNINNIENYMKKHTKERKDFFGNKITKENKKNVHISFKDFFKGKKLCDLINIESFKSFNIIEQNNPKTTKPFCTRCCSIF